LMNPSSKLPQGKLLCWVEILEASDAKRFPLLNIKPPAPLEYEMRVIIWQCKDVVNKDEVCVHFWCILLNFNQITDMNDLYCTAVIDGPGGSRQKTDTHLRA